MEKYKKKSPLPLFILNSSIKLKSAVCLNATFHVVISLFRGATKPTDLWHLPLPPDPAPASKKTARALT